MACGTPLCFSHLHPGVTCAWTEHGWASHSPGHRLEQEGQAVCVYTNTYIPCQRAPHFFLKGIPQLCWNWKHFVFIYHQLVRERKVLSIFDLRSPHNSPEAEFWQRVLILPKKAQSHLEGALGVTNGRNWKNWERKQGSVSYHELIGVAREWPPCSLYVAETANLEMAQCLSVQDLIDGLRWV